MERRIAAIEGAFASRRETRFPLAVAARELGREIGMDAGSLFALMTHLADGNREEQDQAHIQRIVIFLRAELGPGQERREDADLAARLQPYLEECRRRVAESNARRDAWQGVRRSA